MTALPAVLAPHASAVLSWLGQALIIGTALALLTWGAVAMLGRRLSPSCQTALWLIVLLRFAFPVGPDWPWSIGRGIRTIVEWFERSPTAIGSAAAGTRDPIIVVSELSSSKTRESAASNSKQASYRDLFLVAVAAGYLAGVGMSVFVRARAYRHASRSWRRLPPADADLQVLADRISATLGVRRRPTLLIGNDWRTPFVFGLRCPVVVVNSRQLERADELRAVLTHEIAHLRRGDLMIRAIQWCLGSLLFFWPIVAWVNRRLDLAREQAADEWALRHGRLSACQYARCLLETVRIAQCERAAYRPVAMAASMSHVERRIEVILNRTVQRPSTATKVSMGAVLASWSAFALSGGVLAGEPAQPCAKGKNVVVVTHDDDGPAQEDREVRVFINSNEISNTGPDALMHRVRIARGPSPSDLAAFGQAHPTADADGDGAISRDEYHAFLTALAGNNPQAVLAKFPQADEDGDGCLSQSELAMLVTGGTWEQRTEKVDGRGSETERNVMMYRIRKRADGDAAPSADMPSDVAKWLLANSTGEPTAAEVSAQLAAVREAPRLAMLRLHPDADADGDGRLSDVEMQSMRQREHERVMQMILEKYPQADTDGDGKLSREELRQISGGDKVLVRRIRTGEGPEQTDVRIGGDAGDADGIVIIRRDKPEVGK